MNDLYQGSSTSSGKRRERWSSGVLYGLLGCDKSSMLFYQPSSGENRCLHPLDEPGGQGVTAFGNSLPSFQAPSLSQKSGKRLVNTHIGVDAELGQEFQKKFHFWNFGPAMPRVTISSNANYV